MTAPRYLTEPAPVAAVPVDKMYLWIVAIEQLKNLYVERKKMWERHGVAVSGTDPTADSIDEMLMFLRMSCSDYMDWMGMSSEFIDHYIKPRGGDA